MKQCMYVNKPLGLTPLQTVTLFKQQHPAYRDARIGYAGRLDPLAEGLLLLLVGEENKRKKTYEDLSKTYEFEVLFGISTDTYDTLGLITHSVAELRTDHKQLTTKITELLPSLVGKKRQPYPPYSSRTVNGKPLYWYARNKKLDEITIPEREVEIYSLELLSPALLLNKKCEQEVFKRIQLVSGAFRQNEIISSWQSYFDSPSLSTARQAHFTVFRFRINCSSGTYVRSIANSMGEKLGIPTLAYSIKRTLIGEITLRDAIDLTAEEKEDETQDKSDNNKTRQSGDRENPQRC